MNIENKLFMIIVIATISFLIFTNTSFGQDFLDLSTFINVNNGFWLLNSDNTSVKQLQKGSRDFYYLFDQNIINKVITGTIKIDSTTYDNDAFGLVFGYQGINDSYIFSWDKGGVQGEGQIFYHKDRAFDYNQVPGQLLFDGRGSGMGWQKEREYNFKVEYLKDKFKLSINGQEIINIKGEFPKGKFGFFSYSQDKVNYSNIKIINAEHLIGPARPPIEELDNPIKIKSKKEITDIEQFDIYEVSYDIKNSSQYELQKAYIKIDLDNKLNLLKESINTNKKDITINFFKEENIIIFENFRLKQNEVLNLSFYLSPKSSFNQSSSYQNTISAYSIDKDKLVSNKLKNTINLKPKKYHKKALIIGKVSLMIDNNKVNILKKQKRPKLIISDGRVVEVDRNGRYHLIVDNFDSWNEQKIIVLKVMLPKRYNRYESIGNKLNLIKIRPGELQKVDFNIKLGGKDNG